MHGQHAFQRQQEVEHGEDGLLDFAGVIRAADNGQALAEIEDDEGVGAGAVHHGRSQEARHGDHGEFRHVLLQRVLIADLQEHGARKEAVPGLLGDDADGHGVLGIGPGIAVLHKDVAALQVSLQARQQRAEVFAGERTIVGAPPDALFRGLLAHHKLVGRRARRVLAGVHQHRSQVGQAALGAKHNLLVERGRAQVPVRAPQIHQAVVLQPVVTRQNSGFFGSRGNDVKINVHNEFLNRCSGVRPESNASEPWPSGFRASLESAVLSPCPDHLSPSSLHPVPHQLPVAEVKLVGRVGIKRPLNALTVLP